MNKETKLKELQNAFEFIDEAKAQKRKLRKDIYIIKNETPEEIKKFLIDIIYDDNIGGKNDLSYEIVARACELLDEETIDEEEDSIDNESASIWNDERLSYLNNSNEDEIYTILKDYSCESISLACAIWYDEQVKNVYYQLKDFINK